MTTIRYLGWYSGRTFFTLHTDGPDGWGSKFQGEEPLQLARDADKLLCRVRWNEERLAT